MESTKVFYLTYQTEFQAAHFLPNHEGKCRYLHGHTYKLEVTIEGVQNPNRNSPEWGMVMDFHELKKAVQEVVGEYDHHDLNRFILNPTAENILSRIVDGLLEKHLPLDKAVLWETSDCRVEYRG